MLLWNERTELRSGAWAEKKGRSAVAGEPSFLRRPPIQRRCKRPRIGEAIKRRLLFFLLGYFLLRNFLGFLYRFFLSCFLFCHGLDHLLSSVLNCEQRTWLYQTIILFYRQTSQEVLKHFMGRCAKRQRGMQ